MGNFRLASVMRVRELREQQAREEFALSATREREHEEVLARAKHVLQSEYGQIPGPVQNLKAYAAIRQTSMDQLDRMAMMTPRFAAEREAAEADYLQAAQDLKAVEKLKEKHDERAEAAELAAEEEEIDETVMFRSTRL
jgi:flagellar export protein FliJ